LACSENIDHRIGALRLSTYVFEAFRESNFAFDSALRVVLTRLKNFPALETRRVVAEAFPSLPLALAVEETSDKLAHTVNVGDRERVLSGFQRDLWRMLEAGRSVALTAPTSAGKSFVSELYLASIFGGRARTTVFLVPTRALITQVSKEIATIFKSIGGSVPEIVTVPSHGESLPESAVYVLTQERMHLVLQSHPIFAPDLLVVDEAQSIAEGARGILLQGVIEALVQRNPKVQVLFATPNMRNLGMFGSLFGRSDILPHSSTEPAVSQNFFVIKRSRTDDVSVTAIRETGYSVELGQTEVGLPLRTRVEKLAHLPLSLCSGQQNLIYANGADEAEEVALAVAKRVFVAKPSARQLELARLSRETVHPDYILAACALKGVGFHYSNIPANLRQAIEAAFAEGELKYLACISTLLQGVNLPARNIFMLKPTKGQGRPLEAPDFWNLAGRAGRLRREFQGNIFLIDYDDWPRKPVRAPKEMDVAPAIESSIRISRSQLLSVIQGRATPGSKSKKIELETAFVRLFADHKEGRLLDTFSKLRLDDEEKEDLERQLKDAETKVSLPEALLRRNHNVSAHKQQKLFDRIVEAVDKGEAVIPLPPADPQAFNSYAAILKLCHEVILGIDTSKRLYRYHAVLARKWMKGESLPRIIKEGLRRLREKGQNPDVRRYIRSTLEDIEEAIRFQTIRLFGCYRSILEFALTRGGRVPGPDIPDVELFLEIGASSKTMVSLISLGLTRAVAIKLEGARSELDPDLDVAGALEWLRSRSNDLVGLKLSESQAAEVLSVLENWRTRTSR
jgi:replicative superfamily II helicase